MFHEVTPRFPAEIQQSADKHEWFRVILWHEWTQPVMWHQRWQSVSQEFVCAVPTGLQGFALNGLGVNVALYGDALLERSKGATGHGHSWNTTHWHLRTLSLTLALYTSFPTYVHMPCCWGRALAHVHTPVYPIRWGKKYYSDITHSLTVSVGTLRHYLHFQVCIHNVIYLLTTPHSLPLHYCLFMNSLLVYIFINVMINFRISHLKLW